MAPFELFNLEQTVLKKTRCFKFDLFKDLKFLTETNFLALELIESNKVS